MSGKQYTIDQAKASLEDLRLVKNLISNVTLMRLVVVEMRKLLQNACDFMVEKKVPVRLVFFHDSPSQSGQIGIPKTDYDAMIVFKSVLLDGNIREMMSMCMNFYRDQNKIGICGHMMDGLSAFKTKRKISKTWNKEAARKRITDIENILGYGIEECKPSRTGCSKIYSDTGAAYPSLCSLWNPVHFIYASYAVTNPFATWTGEVARSIKPKVIRAKARRGCAMPAIFVNPPLSARETAFGGSQAWKAWRPGMCWYDPIPSSLADKVRRAHRKLSVANTSGHTLLHVGFARLFYTGTARKAERYDRLMMIACFMWMVPFDHSIHEVMTAGKIMNLIPDYNYKEGPKISLGRFVRRVLPRR